MKQGHHIVWSSLQAFDCASWKVMSVRSLGLRNAYNKLETLTALHLKWFQMLKQTAEKRTDGSPPPPLILKKAIFQKKIIFRVCRHFPKYRDSFSQDHTTIRINAKRNTFFNKTFKNLKQSNVKFSSAFL